MKQSNKIKQPIFSVIVPIYNVERYLNKCLSSIFNQNFKNYELILVNDGSTDSSYKICDKYANQPNIKVIHKKNGGLTSARNSGLKVANGKYIIYIDSDDYILPGYFQKCYEIINKYPHLDMIIFCFKFLSNKTQTCEKLVFHLNQQHITDGLYDKNMLEKQIYPHILKPQNFSLTSWRCVFKKEHLLKHYCKNEKISYAEDYAYTYECLFYADNVYFANNNFYVYNDTRNISIMRSTKSKDIYYIALYLKYIFQQLYNNKSTDINKQLLEQFIFEHARLFSYFKYGNIYYKNKSLINKKNKIATFKDVCAVSKMLKQNLYILLKNIIEIYPMPHISLYKNLILRLIKNKHFIITYYLIKKRPDV